MPIVTTLDFPHLHPPSWPAARAPGCGPSAVPPSPSIWSSCSATNPCCRRPCGGRWAWPRPDQVITVAAAGQAVLIRRQYQAIDRHCSNHLLLEPVARNTAAAVALAAFAPGRHSGRSDLWVCPSDHLIPDSDALEAALVRLSPQRQRAGSSPSASRPRGPRPALAGSRPQARRAWRRLPGQRFIEKPEREVAAELLAAGTISGTAACSCSAPTACWTSWSGTRLHPRRDPGGRSAPA